MSDYVTVRMKREEYRELESLRAEVERLRGALEDIAKIDYTTAATTGACHKAVTIARRALGEVEGD